MKDKAKVYCQRHGLSAEARLIETEEWKLRQLLSEEHEIS